MPEWLLKHKRRKPDKSSNSQEWMQKAKQNVEQWKRDQVWLNQFAESAKKQEVQQQAKKTLPSTFHWSPEIAQAYKKTEGWKKINSIANHEFQACVNGQKHEEWKPPLGSEKFEKKEAAMAQFIQGPWPFGYLPEKVCSLASYCRKRKQQGLPLTPAQERFFSSISECAC